MISPWYSQSRSTKFIAAQPAPKAPRLRTSPSDPGPFRVSREEVDFGDSWGGSRRKTWRVSASERLVATKEEYDKNIQKSS